MATSSLNTIFFDTGAQADFFKQNKVILLHCITRECFRVPITSFNVVGVQVRICHISIPPHVKTRRGVLFANRDDMACANSFAEDD